MLSKKQAKLFFLGGTALFALIFLGLSIDSLVNGIPRNTNNDPKNGNDLMTQSVMDGKRIWEEKNCMGCHTIMGEGAYYAPELTKVFERRGPDYIKATFNFPGGWGPNGRKMVQYDFTEEEKQQLVDFFEWTGKMYLNGFPKQPPLEHLLKKNK